MSETEYLVVVYQFGKVASTAMVQSLNACKGVEAHQSHFLGHDALQRIIPNATNPRVKPYFRNHTVGQLINNIELSYQVNCAMREDDPRKLIVVSMSREPLDWLRSCIQQDIQGYEDDIRAYGASSGDDPSELSVANGLIRILDDVADVLRRFGGAQLAIETFGIGSEPINGTLRAHIRDEFARRMFLLALRPLVWFDEHFKRCFDIGLDGFDKKDGFWLRGTKTAQFVLLRYEDIDAGFTKAMLKVGVPFEARDLCHANVSKDKPYAEEIRHAFSGDAAEKLREQLGGSNYAKHFGY